MEPATDQRIASVLPSLDEIASDPGCAGGLTVRTLAALQTRAAAVQAALAAAALAATDTVQVNGGRPTRPSPAADRTLDADEIAAELGQTRRWVFRNAKKLPFLRRVSRKSVVGSAAELRRWRDSQKA